MSEEPDKPRDPNDPVPNPLDGHTDPTPPPVVPENEQHAADPATVPQSAPPTEAPDPASAEPSSQEPTPPPSPPAKSATSASKLHAETSPPPKLPEKNSVPPKTSPEPTNLTPTVEPNVEVTASTPPEQPVYMPPVVDTPSPDATAVVAAMARRTLAEINNQTLVTTSIDSHQPASAIAGADEESLPVSVRMSEAAALNTPTDASSPNPAVDPAQVGVAATTSQSHWHDISPPWSSVLVPVANAPGAPVPATPALELPQMTGLTSDMARPVILIPAEAAVGASGSTKTPRKAPSDPVDPDADSTAVGDAEDEEGAEGVAGEPGELGEAVDSAAVPVAAADGQNQADGHDALSATPKLVEKKQHHEKVIWYCLSFICLLL